MSAKLLWTRQKDFRAPCTKDETFRATERLSASENGTLLAGVYLPAL